jgi:hypothetical protein
MNNGCNGGWPTYSWDYWKTQGTVWSEDYPYENRKATCRDANLEKVFKTQTTAYRYVNYNDKADFKAKLRT